VLCPVYFPLALFIFIFNVKLPFIRLYLFVTLTQMILVTWMLKDLQRYESFYNTSSIFQMVLRYFLIVATYYTLAKDYFTISQLFTILYTRRRCDRRIFYFLLIIVFRIVILAYSEIIIIMIICTTDLASSLGIGLILNFTAGVITCELDDMAMKTQVAQSMVQ
jgi:hypothetical protein